MEEKQRNKVGYYSIIPSKILYNKELKANEQGNLIILQNYYKELQ